MKLRSAPTRLAAVLVGVALLGGACTVPANDDPQAAGNVFNDLVESTTTTTTTTAPEDATKTEPVYLLEATEGANRLQFVDRNFELGATIEDVLNSLLTEPPDTEGDTRPEETGLASAIPQTAALVSAQRTGTDSSELVVDVTGLFGSIDGSVLRNALAQIVWTATEPTDIRSVSFRSNGEARSAIVGNGEEVERAVTRADYTNLG